MKFRKTFVSNSSSSSYTCEICNVTCESLIDFGMYSCKYYEHTFCEEHLTMDIPEKLTLICDGELIIRVLKNLILNAIKFSQSDCSIIVSAKKIKGDYVEIAIKDNGIGITEQEKGLLFEKFGKIERFGMDLGVDIEGSGLGLYISKEIIELHGGQILIESEGRHKGALFIVRLFKN